jgi:hypothetical protein
VKPNIARSSLFSARSQKMKVTKLPIPINATVTQTNPRASLPISSCLKGARREGERRCWGRRRRWHKGRD